MLRKIPLLVIAVAASQCGATECGEVLRDPGFDLWCGEQLCSWKIARGEVHQVPTWNKGDDGAELVGADTAIYQLAPVTSDDGSCIQFELIADVDPDVDLRFQADVFGDGSIELDDPIPSAQWRPLTYRFHIDGAYAGIAFWIVKRSDGHAVVAQLQAQTCGDDDTAVHVNGMPAPAGAACSAPGECASAICTQFPGSFAAPPACGACVVGAACTDAGDVCGYAPPTAYTLGASSACVAIGSKQLGEACGVNEECADGSCSFGVCSSCFGDSCGAGVTCDVSPRVPKHTLPLFDYPAPFVCAPGAGTATAGAPCGANADCASGTCAGSPRLVCEDGRACANDADCPVVDGIDHGVCETVGVIGGTCQ
jgi:hypothetical protein